MSAACDWDGPAVYSEAERVARKEHGCVECRAPILKGERYLAYSGLWDGNWDSGAQHLLCRDACVWVRDAMAGECLCFGGLEEYWEETRSPAALQDYFATYGERGRENTSPEKRKAMESSWRIGARMFAMIRRRERLASSEASHG